MLLLGHRVDCRIDERGKAKKAFHLGRADYFGMQNSHLLQSLKSIANITWL